MYNLYQQEEPDWEDLTKVMLDMMTSIHTEYLNQDMAYRPSLPQRGRIQEPHYSVPRNNSRVKMVGEEDRVVGEENIMAEEMIKMAGDQMERMAESMVEMMISDGEVCTSEEKKEVKNKGKLCRELFFTYR